MHDRLKKAAESITDMQNIIGNTPALTHATSVLVILLIFIFYGYLAFFIRIESILVMDPIYLKDVNSIKLIYASSPQSALYEAEIKAIEKSSIRMLDLYLSIRAFALGGLGSIAMAIMTKSVSTSASHLEDDKGWVKLRLNPLLWTFVGGIVSLVAFGLFYTKQISIFHVPDSVNTQIPDYWRMSILCLIAGAYSETIINTASRQVEIYASNTPRGIRSPRQPRRPSPPTPPTSS